MPTKCKNGEASRHLDALPAFDLGLPNNDSSDTKMDKSRGGQNKHWAEKVRVWTWYYTIVRQRQWSDYALDLEFAWVDKDEITEHRPRTFEWIRKTARQPQGRDARWRSMSELVLAVEAHPDFRGTQSLYEAEFWELLQETLVTPKLVQQRIDKLQKMHGLVRPNPITVPGMGELITKHGLGPVFDRCLQLSMREMDRLSGLALAWSAYLQVEPSHSREVRVVVEAIVDKGLEEFFGIYFPHDPLHFYGESLNVFLQTRLDMSGRGVVGYGHLETIGKWPIIPKALASGVSEEYLFATIL